MSAPSPKLNLEQRRKQAKDLRRAHEAGDPEAAQRIGANLPRLAGRPAPEILQAAFSLQEAQHVIAREGGFRSWRELHAAAVVSGDAPARSQDDWRTRFDEVYRLEPGQAVKRVPPPFIPERVNYFESRDHGRSDPPDTFFWLWDDERDDPLGGAGSGNLGEEGFSLERILRHVLELQTFEYEGPRELLASLKMPGDWIVRESASQAERLAALAQISRRETGWPFESERVEVERQVIVASGEFELSPVDDPGWKRVVLYVHTYELEHIEEDGGGGHAGITTIGAFLRCLGNRVGLHVENRVSSGLDFELECRHLSPSGLFDKSAAERAQKLPLLLANVTAQTGLQFGLEKRHVEVWRLWDGRGDQAESPRDA